MRLKYFAMLRESRGRSEETLTVRSGTSVRDLYRELFPAEHASGLSVAFAVNSQYANEEHRVNDGDEVVFLPPVGGG